MAAVFCSGLSLVVKKPRFHFMYLNDNQHIAVESVIVV